MWHQRPRWFDRVLRQVLLLIGLVGVIAAVQLLVLLALGRLPTDEERTVLFGSTIAAAAAALLYQPVRAWLEQAADRFLGSRRRAPGDVLSALGAGLSRGVPLDELLLDLAEALRGSLDLEAVEVWTSSGGLLERMASDPARGWGTLSLTPTEQSVIARAGVSGPARLGVWLPALLDGRDDRPVRTAPMVNADELLGLVVAERAPGGRQFGGAGALGAAIGGPPSEAHGFGAGGREQRRQAVGVVAVGVGDQHVADRRGPRRRGWPRDARGPRGPDR